LNPRPLDPPSPSGRRWVSLGIATKPLTGADTRSKWVGIARHMWPLAPFWRTPLGLPRRRQGSEGHQGSVSLQRLSGAAWARRMVCLSAATGRGQPCDSKRGCRTSSRLTTDLLRRGCGVKRRKKTDCAAVTDRASFMTCSPGSASWRAQVYCARQLRLPVCCSPAAREADPPRGGEPPGRVAARHSCRWFWPGLAWTGSPVDLLPAAGERRHGVIVRKGR
jgi:hypothetical protein